VGEGTPLEIATAAEPWEPRPEELSRFVRAALDSDDVADVVSLVSRAMRRTLAVFDIRGTPVACAPPEALPEEVHGLARRVVRDRRDTASGGWRALALRGRGELFGTLLVSDEPALVPGDDGLLELVRGLLVDQLRAASLRQSLADERAAALTRRIVAGPPIEPQAARPEARRARMRLAAFYRPALLVSDRDEIDDEVLSRVGDLLRQHAPASLVVRHDSRAVVLLLAQEAAGSRGDFEIRFAFEEIVALVSRRLPAAHARIILAANNLALPDLPIQIRELVTLRRYPLLLDHCSESHVIPTSRYALLRMLDDVDHKRAAEFVLSRIGPLLAYDEAHNAALAEALEVSLDWPNREAAARHAYMHRNTFRRRLKQACELIGSRLVDPEERLAVHVALKLTRVLRAPGGARPLPAPSPSPHSAVPLAADLAATRVKSHSAR
jgi:sugar diacid utilization regulator